MGSQTLQHCQVVPMDPPIPSGPSLFTVGGQPSDGHVRVSIETPTGPRDENVNCGESRHLDFSDATLVMLHYMKTETGPESIDVSWED